MTESEIIKKLRNREVLRFFNRKTKVFTRINLNKKDSRVCWERWESLDQSNWICQNLYLSLKDVLTFRRKLIAELNS